MAASRVTMQRGMRLLLASLWLVIEPNVLLAADFVWELGPTGTKASLRGLSAPSDAVLWACGSQSTVVSLDG